MRQPIIQSNIHVLKQRSSSELKNAHNLAFRHLVISRGTPPAASSVSCGWTTPPPAEAQRELSLSMARLTNGQDWNVRSHIDLSICFFRPSNGLFSRVLLDHTLPHMWPTTAFPHLGLSRACSRPPWHEPLPQPVITRLAVPLKPIRPFPPPIECFRWLYRFATRAALAIYFWG